MLNLGGAALSSSPPIVSVSCAKATRNVYLMNIKTVVTETKLAATAEKASLPFARAELCGSDDQMRKEYVKVQHIELLYHEEHNLNDVSWGNHDPAVHMYEQNDAEGGHAKSTHKRPFLKPMLHCFDMHGVKQILWKAALVDPTQGFYVPAHWIVPVELFQPNKPLQHFNWLQCYYCYHHKNKLKASKGKAILCDFCPRAYHGHCLRNLNVAVPLLNNEKWRCPECAHWTQDPYKSLLAAAAVIEDVPIADRSAAAVASEVRVVDVVLPSPHLVAQNTEQEHKLRPPQVLKRKYNAVTSSFPPAQISSLDEPSSQPKEKKTKREDATASPTPSSELSTFVVSLKDVCEQDLPNQNRRLTFQTIHHYFTQFLGNLNPEYLKSLVTRRFLSRVQQFGTILNKRVYIGVSSIRSTCMSSSHVSLNHAFSRDEKETNEKVDTEAVQQPSNSNELALEEKHNRMLGLYSRDTIQAGEYVTLYGGIQSWAGPGNEKITIKGRRPQCNTHVRRVPRSDFAMDGRPWSMLFPRIFSLSDDTTRVEPVVTSHSLINLLLLLHHESTAACHSLQKQRQDGSTGPSCDNSNVSTKTLCRCCQTEVSNIIAHTHTSVSTAGHDLVSSLSEQDARSALQPRCQMCEMQVCMLPCEVKTLLSTWNNKDCAALELLCQQVCLYISSTGVGYMANTDNDKSVWNVRVLNINPYVSPSVCASLQILCNFVCVCVCVRVGLHLVSQILLTNFV
jgi:hypothetical protein